MSIKRLINYKQKAKSILENPTNKRAKVVKQEFLFREEESSDYEESEESSWISSFCETAGHEFFVEVDEAWIRDEFNLYGLESKIENYRENLNVILNSKCESDSSSDNENAELLYGLIHARFLVTVWGLEKMFRKYNKLCFGVCPRYYCQKSKVLPIGISDIPGTCYVKLFCPTCNDIYESGKEIDGAYFGTTFPHLLLQTYPALLITEPELIKKFVPRIFGFKIHHTSHEVIRNAYLKELEANSK